MSRKLDMSWQCRVAPSLGDGFAGTPNEVWGTVPYEKPIGPTVFFGVYGLPDFYTLWRHQGRKAILWAGSDIRHLANGYWLDDVGQIRIDPAPICDWINLNCESYVENEKEKDMLWSLGIKAEAVIPSFLGDINAFQPQVIKEDKLQYYTSVSGDDFSLYGWDKIDALANAYPEVEFHLYGNREPWITMCRNVVVHGRMEREEMDSQIKEMTGALRLTTFDGFSEILAKSVLWGQKPVSPYIKYQKIATEIGDTIDYNARKYYIDIINQYPWNVKNNKQT